jgi:hypothetical protein
MHSKLATLLAAMIEASIVGAHLVMVDPVPYNSNPSNNSPLDASGSNFPCKITGDYSVIEENHMVKGESQSLIFHGGTTHGGGSCQISITSDRAPSKDTTWSVIKSIEGGCMDATESDVSMGNSPTMATPFSLNFTIPDSFKTGQYTIAWTWFNRIGNREMYMNCAPITLTESSSSAKNYESAEVEESSPEDFPPLFIANINGCLTKPSYDIRFPNPGNTIQYLGPEEKLIGLDDDVCFIGAATWGQDGHSAAGYSAHAAKSSSSTRNCTTTTNFKSSTTAGSTEKSSASKSLAVNVANCSTKSASSVQIDPTAKSSDSFICASSPSFKTLTESYSEEGIWNCIGGTFWQRCAGGIWTSKQPMPDGTECTSGPSQNFIIKTASSKSQKKRALQES